MKKTELFLGLLIIVFGIGLFVLTRETAEKAPPPQTKHAPATVAASEVPLPSISFEQDKPKKTSTPKPTPQLTQAPAQPAQNDQQLEDPDARDALALVGLDSEADIYWLDAIFDSSLPDTERAGLVEDLNEVGFDDPKNLTADDLPVILNRLELIDALLPNVDDFMSEHLLEAQKDLSNMLAGAANSSQQ